MKKTLIAAVGLLAIGATTASAQYRDEYRGRERGERRFEERHEDRCRGLGNQVAELLALNRAGRANHDHRQALIRLKTDYDRNCRGRDRF